MPAQRDANGRFLPKNAQPRPGSAGGGSGAGGSQVIERQRAGVPTRAQLAEMIRQLGQTYVKVGVPNNADQPKTYYADRPAALADEKSTHPELTLVEVATFNEFGTRDGRVPSRPFMATAAASGRTLLKQLTARLWVSVIRGKRDYTEIPELLGLEHQGQIQAVIAEGVDPPNAAETIYNKGSSRTLVATGQLRQSITYSVTRDKPAGAS